MVRSYTWVPYAGLAALLMMLAGIPNIAEPVIRDDPDRNIQIPRNLLHTMRVKAAYNDETMFFRFELPAERPAFHHDVVIHDGNGRWVREGHSPVGYQENHVYEDRISFFLDDGRVPEFGKWGGFITASGREMRFFTNAASQEVKDHPHFGPKGVSDVRKYLPETRTDVADWRTVKSPEELRALQEAGYFLDLWQWRAHRSNPVGWADDQYILDYRWSDEGRGMYLTNWDAENQRPLYMFDPGVTGQVAMRWDGVVSGTYSSDDSLRYALIIGTPGTGVEGNAIPFDPDREWKAGDTIPRRVLRVPDGSRGNIRAHGEWRSDTEGGAWHVDLWRTLDTGAPLDDKVLHHKGLYQVAFAAHINATGSRWHYVSFPMTLGLEREADIAAARFDGERPPWDEIAWHDLTLFYPGQIDWAHLVSEAHAGAEDIAAGKPIAVGHDVETLAQYAVQTQFRHEIRSQWRQTTFALLGMTILVAAGVFLAAGGGPEGSREEGSES